MEIERGKALISNGNVMAFSLDTWVRVGFGAGSHL